MAMNIYVDIVSTEELIFSGFAQMVFAPATMGEIGITPHHVPLLSPLVAGEVRVVTKENQEEFFFISGGMLEIQPHIVTILADTAKQRGRRQKTTHGNKIVY